MYQGCIIRNMRTSCGSRTFPESSNSEGSKISPLTLHRAAVVPKPYPAAHLLLSQDSRTRRRIRKMR